VILGVQLNDRIFAQVNFVNTN